MQNLQKNSPQKYLKKRMNMEYGILPNFNNIIKFQ